MRIALGMWVTLFMAVMGTVLLGLFLDGDPTRRPWSWILGALIGAFWMLSLGMMWTMVMFA